MNPFPLTDPIPLPAPVWLFKSLHILTLSLHFAAVEILLGSLFVATTLNFFGSPNSLRRAAAVVLARRLPIVMTYVINLGVPPLLFAQVLYGPAFYTSNVLIGAYWFSVVFLLMACYWLLYRFADGTARGKSVWWKGALAWLLAASVARILSTNMTLMLKPEVWQEMYSVSALGIYLPPYDATLMPRWLFMLTGGFWVTGLWMVWIAGRKTVKSPLNSYLVTLGGRLAALMVIAQASQLYLVLRAQPSVVIEGITVNVLLKATVAGWCVAAVCVSLFGVWVSLKKPCTHAAGYIAALLTVISVATWTTLRDGIRDLSLASKGFDVWRQSAVTDWGVVAWFFLVLGFGLVALAWLVSVMMRSKPVAEGGLS